MLGLISRLGQPRTVSAGLVVFVGGSKLGGVWAPAGCWEADGRMGLAWEMQLWGRSLLAQTRLLPGSNLRGCINSLQPAGYHLVSSHCIPER